MNMKSRKNEYTTDLMMSVIKDKFDAVEYLTGHYGTSVGAIIAASLMTGLDAAMNDDDTAFRENLERTTWSNE